MHAILARAPRLLSALAAILLAGCHHHGDDDPARGGAGSPAYHGIAPDETIYFTGTNPFWGGKVTGENAQYTTSENIAGDIIVVRRFAGNNGLGFSGDYGHQPFDLAVTLSDCRDGKSDRSYPFMVTLEVKGETRQGCGWTDKRPYSGAPKR